MDNEIQKLSTKLEELKKRLKAINTSQNILSKLITIQDYFDQIQGYLNDLNNAFNNHIISCDEHDQLIKELQEQINSINLKLESLPNIEDYNIEQMSADIENLKQNITDITAEISAFKGNSNSTIETIDNKLTEFNQNLEELITKVNTNTSDISSLKTTTQNLSTTQTNLTATQTTLTNNINSIDRRLTNAEKELSAVTGSIDLTELNERVNAIENGDVAINYYSFKNYNYGFTPADKIMYTQEYYFSSEKVCSYQCFDLSYTSQGVGFIQVEIYNNKEVIKAIEIDLSKYPTNYRIHYDYIPKYKGQSAMLKLTTSTDITYNSMIFSVYGKKVQMYNHNNLYVYGFNNNLYINKVDGNVVKYGKFSSVEEIDLDNLPFEQSLEADGDASGYHTKLFIPYPIKENLYFSGVCDASLNEAINNYIYTNVLTQSETGIIMPNATVERYASTPTNIGRTAYLQGVVIKDGCLYYYTTTSSNSLKAFTLRTNDFSGEWLYAIGVDKINGKTGDRAYYYDETPIIGLYEDGNFYFFYSTRYASYIKIGKGTYATAYSQTAYKHNIYIFNNNSIDKYSVNITSSSSTCSYLETIPDCDCVYELLDGNILKHTISTNEWLIQKNT